MKNTKTKIKKYTFLNAWEIEYQIGKDYFVMAIETENLEGWDSEKYDSPQDFLEETDADIEEVIISFHIEMADVVEPMDKQFSKLYQPKKAKKVIFKPTLESIETTPATLEMVNPAYILERMENMQKEINQLKEENKKRDDILLTTNQIEEMYGLSPQTMIQAKNYNRIPAKKINGKEWGFAKKDVDAYIEKNRNQFKNLNLQYAS